MSANRVLNKVLKQQEKERSKHEKKLVEDLAKYEAAKDDYTPEDVIDAMATEKEKRKARAKNAEIHMLKQVVEFDQQMVEIDQQTI